MGVFISILIGLGLGITSFYFTQDAMQSFVWGFLGSLATAVSQELVKRWSVKIADVIDDSIGDVLRVFSGFERVYLKHIQERLIALSVRERGLAGAVALNLKDIYVELSLGIDDSLSPETSNIWKLLKRKKYPHFVIVGEPGSGKTTLLQHIALILASDLSTRRAQDAPNLLPLWLTLSDCSKTLANKADATLEDALCDKFNSDSMKAPVGWFRAQLLKKRCMVLLDSLDEVNDRQAIVVWVRKQILAYPDNVYILTSRPKAYEHHPLDSIERLRIRPFTSSQMKAFVRSWYLATEQYYNRQGNENSKEQAVRMQNAKEEAERQSNKLIQRLGSSSDLFEMGTNPRLLDMIATIHRVKELPDRRADLYRDALEVFLETLDRRRGVATTLNAQQRIDVLKPLAYQMMLEKTREIAKARVLERIEAPLKEVSAETEPIAFILQLHERTGVFLEMDYDEWRFSHKTFQEYIAAVNIKDEELESDLLKQIDDDYWEECLRLYAAIIPDASNILKVCLERKLPDRVRLALAIEREKRAIKDVSVQKELREIQQEWIEGDELTRRSIVADAMLRQREREGFREIGIGVQGDISLVTHAEYQLFLDEMSSKGQYFYPDHWKDMRFVKGQAYNTIVGMTAREAERFCRWLSDRNSRWNYRLPNEAEAQEVHLGQDVLENCAFWVKGDYSQFSVFPKKSEWYLRDESVKWDTWISLGYISFLARALDLARVLAGSLTRVFASSLVTDLARALDLARTGNLDNNFIRALDSALDSALDGVSDSVSAIALGIDSIIDSTSETARNFIRALTIARDSVHTLDSALDSVSDSVPAIALGIDSTIALVSAIDHARTIARDSVRAIARVQAIAGNLDSTRAIALDDALTGASDIARVLDSVRDLAIAQDSVRAIARVQAIARNVDSTRASGITLTSDLASTNNLALTSAQDLSSAVSRNINHKMDFVFILMNSIPIKFIEDLWQNTISSVTIKSILYKKDQSAWIDYLASLKAHAVDILGQVEENAVPPNGFRRFFSQNQQTNESQLQRDGLQSLITNLELLEARRQGKAQPFEAIWLVREPKQE